MNEEQSVDTVFQNYLLSRMAIEEQTERCR